VGNVLVVGSFNTDLMMRTSKLPEAGETVFGSVFLVGPGGKGANQAIAAARLGAKVRFVGCLGTDTFGDLAQSILADEGVDTAFIKRSADSHTGAAMILVNELTGENWITVVPGANLQLRPDTVDAALENYAEPDVLLLQLEIPLPTVERVASIAHDKGVRIILNPAPAQELPEGLLSSIDVLTPNERELEELTGLRVDSLSGIETAAKTLVPPVSGAVVVTLGANGVLRVSSEGTRHFPGREVEAVDTTGAGDSFNGALAAAIAAGSDLDGAISFANAAAALSVTRVGTALAMPTLSEVRALLQTLVEDGLS